MKIRHLLATSIFSSLMFGAAPLAAESVELTEASENPLVEQARRILDKNLIDYTQARLSEFKLLRYQMPTETSELAGVKAGSQIVVFCGEINAPNRLGGMTGWIGSGVILEGGGQTTFVQDSDEDMRAKITYRMFCPFGMMQSQDAAPDYSEALTYTSD